MLWRILHLFLVLKISFGQISPAQTGGIAQPLIIDSLKGATRVAISPEGEFYLYEKGTNALRKYSSQGESLATVSGFNLSVNSFHEISDLSAPTGLELFVSDHGNNRVIQYDRKLNVSSVWKTDDVDLNRSASFRYPRSLDMDLFGNLYLLDGEKYQVIKLKPSRKVERIFGGFDAGSGRLNNPTKMRVGKNNNIIVLDGSRIVVFDQLGNLVSVFRNDSLKEIDSFCLVDGDILSVSGAELNRIRGYAAVSERVNIGDLGWFKKGGKVADIAYQNKMIYFIFPDRLARLPIVSIFK